MYFKGITIEVQWVPREENSRADYLSKIMDYEYWGVTDEFLFLFLLTVYGPSSILTDMQETS